MKGKMCKRIFVLLMAFMLCFESTVPVSAASDESILMQVGNVTKEMPQGMQPFDISEEAIAAAEMSEEEFMKKFGLDRTKMDASETEMERTLGIARPVTEEVSANTISVNSADVLQERATTYATLEDAADYVRGKMVARKEDTITIRVAGNKDGALKSVEKILDKVFEYDMNGAPDEGDYLNWHMKSMKGFTPTKNSDGTYTIRFVFEYLTTASEEKFVTKKVNAIVKNLNLKSTTLNDYQKVRAIYDYIMSIIVYDHYHYTYDRSYDHMYTTYGALDSGFAVCQAYASLFYRLSEEAGISARVICGNDDADGSPTHGWNIVKIGSYYYNLDATWDDEGDVPTHIYFLKNMEDFTGHQRNEVNDGKAFDKQFPTSPVSYPIPELDTSANYSGEYGNMPAIQAFQTRNDQVKLSWTPYSGATGYRVYRKNGAGEYCCVTTTAGTSFSDEVSSVGSYVYQIKALNGSKEIAASPEKAVSVKTMLLKKGKTFKVGNYKYKVLQSTQKTKTVAFAGVTNKKLTKILIPDKVKINGLTYKVTEISAKALKGNKKVKTVSIGANVTKIGKQAFYKAGKLANIVVKTKKLKSVGSKALYGISKKAEIRVPNSKYKKYQKVFKEKGQNSSVKIKK